MKTLSLAILVLFAVSLPAPALEGPKGFESGAVTLYQPDATMEARVPSVADLASYIKQLQAVCSEFFANTQIPENLHVVVAIRPAKRARVWFVSSTRPAPDAQREPLRKKLESVPPCEVLGGPVAFAILGKIAGGEGKNPKPKRGENIEPPLPKEWVDAAIGKKDVLVPDGFLDLVWPDKK